LSRPSAAHVRCADLLLVAVVAALCLYARQKLLVRLPCLDADETGHALPAARMALALASGNLHGFLEATWREALWPFVHPWVVTPFFLGFGISAAVARTVSLLALVAAATLLPPLTRRLAAADGGAGAPAVPATAGWLAAAALLGAPLWHFWCTAMSESLGMLVTVAALCLEADAAARPPRVRAGALCGFLGALAFLIKYSYGFPLIGALLLAQAVRVRGRGYRPLVGVLAGCAAPLAAWALFMLGPDWTRARFFIDVLINRDEGLRGWEALLFYPRVLVGWLGAPGAAVAFFGVAVTATVRASRGRALTALLFVTLTLAQLTAHANEQARYLVPALPVLLALGELGWLRFVAWPRRAALRSVGWAALAVAVAVARDPGGQIREAAAADEPLRASRAILGFVAAAVPREGPLLLLGTTGRLPHFALTWELLEHEARERDVELLQYPGERGWDPRFRAGYPAQMTAGFRPALLDALDRGGYAAVVTFRWGPRSAFLPDWLAKWDAWGQNYVVLMQEQDRYLPVAERAFPDADAMVRVYRPGGRR